MKIDLNNNCSLSIENMDLCVLMWFTTQQRIMIITLGIVNRGDVIYFNITKKLLDFPTRIVQKKKSLPEKLLVSWIGAVYCFFNV